MSELTPEELSALKRLARKAAQLEAILAAHCQIAEIFQKYSSTVIYSPIGDPPRAYPERPVWLGNGRVQLGDTCVRLDDSMGQICELFAKRGPSLSYRELDAALNTENAFRYLKRIRDRFPMLAPFIKLPGGRGKGGYQFDIIDGEA